METKQFVTQLNYPTRKVDGNFILNNKVETVLKYLEERQTVIDESEIKRNEIISKNKEAVDILLSYLLDDLKIDQWKIFKKKKRGRGWTATTVRGDIYAHWKKAFEDVKAYVPLRIPKVVDFGSSNIQYDLTYNNVTLSLRFHKAHTLEDIFEQSKVVIKRYEDSVAKENKLLVASKDFLDKRNADYSQLITGKEIIELADETAREEYHEAQDGLEIDVTHSDGDDCTWIIGERRCECSNNRYYLEIEGDLINGYYSYGQWH
ncbi:hypothetical protein NVP1161O_142 [Vibrio phage 1.161.O._10N.261.48.C5]|nr:hypothetical protein NVP1161O_142 [Vibrio phage 1.161.O._10N.261.48.C5]